MLSIAIRTAGGALLEYPTDQNVTVGEEVMLPCKTNLSFVVYWYFNGQEVFYGAKVSASYKAMFKIVSEQTGEYNLVISSADESHNGKYMCGDDEGTGERKSAHLYVTGTFVQLITSYICVRADRANGCLGVDFCHWHKTLKAYCES